MDWEECCKKRIVKEINKDEDFIKSLIRKSRNKLKSEKKLEMEDVTASSKVSLAYDSIRELLEALAIKKGYKVYNHVCYTAFLKEIMKNSDLGERFDEIRKTRNSINYYDKEISVNEAKKVINEIKELRREILELLKGRK